jgi:P-aminobenzoate N-oxygenase AurF
VSDNEPPFIAGGRAFDTWYERSGVRSGARRLAGTGTEAAKALFPERLILHLSHPLIDPADQRLRRYLAAQHLYQWLLFTMHLEVSVVNRATQRLASGRSGLDLPAAARLDAYRIAVDESYHSLCSLDIVEQLQQQTGITALPYDFGPFLTDLDAVGADLPGHRQLVQLLQVVVFETLITSILSDIPGDESVVTVVREVVGDHAADERRHHAYFASLFPRLWGQLEPATRRQLALCLPAIIIGSLRPATQPAYQALREAGYAERQAREIVLDSYDTQTVLRGIRVAAAKTIRLFQIHGVLDLPGVRDRFAAAGLLPAG